VAHLPEAAIHFAESSRPTCPGRMYICNAELGALHHYNGKIVVLKQGVPKSVGGKRLLYRNLTSEPSTNQKSKTITKKTLPPPFG
jgi:hypothetical protein